MILTKKLSCFLTDVNETRINKLHAPFPEKKQTVLIIKPLPDVRDAFYGQDRFNIMYKHISFITR